MSALADEGSALQYKRMRAPQENGSVLHIPSESDVGNIWNANVSRQHAENSFRHSSLQSLQQSGRAELVDAAIAYTRQHGNDERTDRSHSQIVMAGHQPTLFHPGVWYKNFVLSELGARFNCIAINLVVDNDICGNTSVSVPFAAGDDVMLKNIAFDDAGPVLPFEDRKINNQQTFESFGSRAADAIQPVVQNPICKRLWSLVQANRVDDNLGLAIARGRHAFESTCGLNTLELPISQLATCRAFALFAKEIVTRIREFVLIYNQIVAEYRAIHKIRSRAHPVPDLAQDDGWYEAPFWIWQANQPKRRSLFVNVDKAELQFTDRNDVKHVVPENSVADWVSGLPEQNIRFRPKALITTMFSRLIASDMFIHGIGGSKYDQLTDEIARQFFNVALPDYLTMTATMRLQSEFDPIEKSLIGQLDHQIRRLTFHPESFVDNPTPECHDAIKQKQSLIREIPPPGNRLDWHHAIEQCNLRMQPFVQQQRVEWVEKRKNLQEKLPRAQLLNSREYSYSLFDPTLVGNLTRLSKQWSSVPSAPATKSNREN